MATTTTYINSVTVQGFIGANAQPKELEGDKAVLNFSVATSRFRGEGTEREQFTEWHRVAVWDKLAVSTGFVPKGAHVKVTGELRSREYTGANGKVQTYEIVARTIELVPRTTTEQPAPSQPPVPEPPPAVPQADPPAAPKAKRKRKGSTD
jgi:single-strand DNA-binding protein